MLNSYSTTSWSSWLGCNRDGLAVARSILLSFDPSLGYSGLPILQITVHRRRISSMGARHAEGRLGDPRCAAPSPLSSHWAVHWSDIEVSCVPVAGEDIADRTTCSAPAI